MNIEEKLAKIPGNVLFFQISGSCGFNLNLVDSDLDYFAVFALPTREILSLYSFTETLSLKLPGGEDLTAHEVGKFCRLLLKGNPGIIETLFVPKEYALVLNLAFEELIANRRLFLSQDTLSQYFGYASGQLQRLEGETRLHTAGGRYNTKWAVHLLRLLNEAERIVSGGDPKVYIEGDEREFLITVRKEHFKKEEIIKLAREKIYSIKKKRPSALPEHNDMVFLNNWLIDIREKEMRA